MPPKKSRNPFKHASPEDVKNTDNYYTDLKLKAQTRCETNCSSASAKYFCYHGSGAGGKMLVMSLNKPGRKLRANQGICSYHGGNIQCSEWSPHNDNILVSGDSQGVVKMNYFNPAHFGENGLMSNKSTEENGNAGDIKEATMTLNCGLAKSITTIKWHPSVQNLVAVGSKDNKIVFMDASTGEKAIDLEIVTEENPVSIDWSWQGNMICYVTKTGTSHTLHLYDINAEKCIWSEALGMKACQSFFMCTDEYQYVAACGLAANVGKRLFKVFDAKDNVGAVVCSSWNIPEKGSQAIMPQWESSRQLLWYYGKGDLSVSFAAWDDKKKSFLTLGFQRGPCTIKAGCFINQRAMQTDKNEIQSFYAMCDIQNTTAVIPFSFVVPRRQQGFAKDLYPDVQSAKPVMDVETFKADMTAVKKPNTVSIEEGVNLADGEVAFVKKMTYKELTARVAELEKFLTENREKIEAAGLDLASLLPAKEE